MPIYTYECQSCEDVVEKRQSFSDAPLTTCESCSGALRKVLHPVGIVFKGSGFYNTDYKNSGGAAKSTADAAKTDGASTTAASDGGAKTDSSTKSESAKAESASSSATKTEASPAGAKAS